MSNCSLAHSGFRLTFHSSIMKNYVKTSTAAVDPQHLNVEVTDQDFPNCSYVINRTCQYLILIM